MPLPTSPPVYWIQGVNTIARLVHTWLTVAMQVDLDLWASVYVKTDGTNW